MTLRLRISAAFAAAAATTALVFGVLVYERTAADSASHARSLETQRARIAASLFDSTGRLAFSATVNDPSAPAPLRAATGAGEVASFLGRAEGAPAVWAGAPVTHGGGAIFVRASFAPSEIALSSLRRSLIEIGALVTLGMALLGLLFAARLSARLRHAARIAGEIGGADPEARIGMGGHDEVAALSSAVDRMADSLQQRIERERRFSGDVAHELRTPISGLIASAALLDDGEAAAMVRDRATRLARLTEDLLEISRLEAGVESATTQSVDLVALVRNVCGECAAEVSVKVVSEAVPIRTDPRRLARILANLLDNSCRHGAEPVVVEVGSNEIRVIDAGPGFGEDMLVHATERFSAGSNARGGGTGLGLAIAAGQAAVIGATLTLGDREDGGAIVTVTLPTDGHHRSAA